MKLLPGQLQALKAQRQASFLRRVAAYAQAMAGQLPDHETLSQLFDRGSTCGLVSEQQLAGFMVLGWIAWARQSGTGLSVRFEKCRGRVDRGPAHTRQCTLTCPAHPRCSNDSHGC